MKNQEKPSRKQRREENEALARQKAESQRKAEERHKEDMKWLSKFYRRCVDHNGWTELMTILHHVWKVQAMIRGYLLRLRLTKLRDRIPTLQALVRGFFVRKNLSNSSAITMLQSLVRAKFARHELTILRNKRMNECAITLQCSFRTFLAHKKLKFLRLKSARKLPEKTSSSKNSISDMRSMHKLMNLETF